MRHCNPGQNQESSVIGDEANIAPPRFGAPADVAVTAAQMARGRTPRHTRYRTSLCPTNILQVLADRLLIAEVVILLHQAVEQRLIRGASHRLDLNRAQ